MTLPIPLPQLADYAWAMSADEENPPTERRLWESIATEITQYIHPANQHTLFNQPKDPT